MRFLVAQTTRMGDMIQTSPLIRQIRTRHPEAHITALVRGMGKIIAERHPDVDEIVVYNEDEMFANLCARDSDRLLEAYNEADRRIRELRDANFDVAYNATHSIASAMLMKLTGIPEVHGAHLSDDGQYLLRGNWTKYFFTSVFNRDYNDLNLCDISRNFAEGAPQFRELVFEVSDEDRVFVSDLLRNHSVGKGDFVACMQLGASEEGKQWTAERFAGLARLLAEERGARIFLVGVMEEAPLGGAFEEHAPDLAVPLFGGTTIPQLAALLERADVLVTNDTGTMHLAAAVGCPVALVSVGPVHYRETGPYGAGHCAIEWRRDTLGPTDLAAGDSSERSRIQPAQVQRAVQVVLDGAAGGDVPQIAETPELTAVDLYLGRFAPDGFLQCYPVIRRAMTQRDFIRIAYRAMWIEHLTGERNQRRETESLRRMLGHYDGPEAGTIEGWSSALTAAFKELSAMSQRGMKTTQGILAALAKPKGIVQAKGLVGELMALDDKARILGEVNPAIRPLVMMARYERDALEGADPSVLANTTLDIYRSCYRRTGLMVKKLARVAALWPLSTDGRTDGVEPHPTNAE